jgi:rod shape-determining protein MreD
MVGCLLAFRSVAGLLLVPQPALGFALLQTVWSILCYPLVVGFSQLVLDLRKPATGEVDDYGRRL